MARPTNYDEKYPDMLIEHMKTGLSFPSFAGKIGVCVATLYNWEKDHAEFLEAKKIGEAHARLVWEEWGMVGLFGMSKDKTGRPMKFNPTIWIFSMKNKFGWKDQPDSVTVEKGSDEKLVINFVPGGAKKEE